MLLLQKHIGDGRIVQEVENVLVELPILGSTTVVPTLLVSSVDYSLYLLYKIIPSGQHTGVRV